MAKKAKNEVLITKTAPYQDLPTDWSRTMNNLILDLANVQTEADFHELASIVFRFPHYYGRNLDAFWDCISEIFEQTTVQVLHLNSLPPDIRACVNGYLDLLQEYAAKRKGKFAVVFGDSETTTLNSPLT